MRWKGAARKWRCVCACVTCNCLPVLQLPPFHAHVCCCWCAESRCITHKLTRYCEAAQVPKLREFVPCLQAQLKTLRQFKVKVLQRV